MDEQADRWKNSAAVQGADRFGRQMASVSMSGRLLFGLILLTLGALFLLDNFGMVDAHRIIRWWPAVLIVIGVAKLLGLGTTRHLVWGALFTLFGTIWLGEHLGFWDFEIWNLWPVVLIVLGGSMLSRGLRPRSEGAEAALAENPDLRSFAFMSGVTRRIASQSFRGGELSAVMGGVELDLRGAKAEGGRAVIEVFVWWGGIDIQVSDDWRVSNEGLALMGAVEDNSKPSPNATQLLVIKGLVVMGGVEIKN